MNPWIAMAVLFGSSCLWGLSWWPLKQLAERGLSGVPLIWVAYGSVALLLLPILWRERNGWRTQIPFLLLIMGLGGLANLSFAGSLIYGEVIRVMALFYLLPVWGILGGRLFLGEALTPSRLCALMLALSGAFFLLGGTAILEAPPSWIDLLAILSGMAFAMNNLAFRATPSMPVASKIAAMFFGCGLMSSSLLATGFQEFPPSSTQTLLYAVIFGVAGLLVATSATQWAVTHLEAGRSAIIMVMELVAAVVSASIITRVNLSPGEMLGASLILIATLVEARTSNASTAPYTSMNTISSKS